MRRFDWEAEAKRDLEKKIDKLTFDHFAHFRAYIHAPIGEKYFHLTKVMKVWRELRVLQATSEAHRRAINYAHSIGLVKEVGIPR